MFRTRYIRNLIAVLALVASVLTAAPLASAEAPGSVNLGRGQSVKSPDGNHTLVHQADGNVVLYSSAYGAIWSTGTHGRSTSNFVFQGDGNLVLYNGSTPLWHTSTHGRGAALYVQNDGNVVIYDAANKPVWASRGIPKPAPTYSSSTGSVDGAITRHFGAANTRLGAQARRVAQCESQMKPTAKSPTNDHGLFQINARYHQTAFRNVTGQPFYNGVYGPDANARYARDLYNRSGGWGPWTCKP